MNMLKNEELSNIKHTFVVVFILVFGLTLIAYRLWGFEVALLLCLSLTAGVVSMAGVGVENIIILANRDK